MFRRSLVLIAVSTLVLPSCKDDADGTGSTTATSATVTSDGTDTGTSTTDSTAGATTSATTGDSSDSAGTTADPSTSGATTGSVFIEDPDGGSATECDLWAQDCPPGDKCMPWANDGGSSWNAAKCSPVDANPQQPGDECTVEGSGVSGVDSCDVSSMCWDVDGETGLGTCVGFCKGSAASPTCEDPKTECSISNDGVLILCLPLCNPLLQDCPDGSACYPEEAGYICSPDASGDQGAAGDPCEYINVCDPGLWCADATAVAGCVGGTGCCTPFCDLDAATNDCPGAAMGEECTGFYEEGEAPPGLENVGGCVIPQ
jgi:hypothetical protein